MSRHEIVSWITLGGMYLTLRHLLAFTHSKVKRPAPKDSKKIMDEVEMPWLSNIALLLTFAMDATLFGLSLAYIVEGNARTEARTYGVHKLFFSLYSLAQFVSSLISAEKYLDLGKKSSGKSANTASANTAVMEEGGASANTAVKAGGDPSDVTAAKEEGNASEMTMMYYEHSACEEYKKSGYVAAASGFFVTMFLFGMWVFSLLVEILRFHKVGWGEDPGNWNKISFTVCTFSTILSLYYLAYYSSLGKVVLFWHEHKAIASTEGFDEFAKMLAKCFTWTDKVLYVMLPWPFILGLNYAYFGMFAELLGDYGRVMAYAVLCVMYPMFICAMHQTYAAWFEHYVFSVKTFFQLMYMLPALFRIGYYADDTAQVRMDSSDPRNFLLHSNNTGLMFDVAGVANDHLNLFRYGLALDGLLVIAYPCVFLLSGMVGMMWKRMPERA